MSVEGAQVTVTTSPTLITSGVDSRVRGAILICNRGTAAIFLGGPAVTTAGFQVDVGQAVPADVTTPADAIYGITASGTQRVDVLRCGS